MEKTTKKWYTRGYIPHFDDKRTTQSITFRLADSFPKELTDRLRSQLEQQHLQPLQFDLAWRKKTERIMDSGYGACHLRDPKIGKLVQGALLYFDEDRYELHTWAVMPNHVHVLLTQYPDCSLKKILHSWCSYTATKANRILGREGQRFWAKGFFDRFIRNERHFENAFNYIEENPVKAGLCGRPEEWPFSGAGFRHQLQAKIGG